MIATERRAAAVLYNFLVSNPRAGRFLLPANICPIVPITFMKAGVPMHGVDIVPDTCSLDLQQTDNIISEDPGEIAGVLLNHTYGLPGDFEQWFRQLKQAHPDILIIDDRCACPPSFTHDPCNPADLVLYSTGYAKHTDVGVGGYGFLQEGLRYERSDVPYSSEHLQTLTEAYKKAVVLQTPFRHAGLDWLDLRPPQIGFDAYRALVTERQGFIQKHKDLMNRVYQSRLPAHIQMRPDFQSWRFNLLVDDRDTLLDAVFSGGLFASAHYRSLEGSFFSDRFPVATDLASRVVNLFNDHHVNLDAVERMCTIIMDHLANPS